ncbi:MAG: hypothetical protein LH473_06880 [Chitinophagales bacterium]|nr:hypothetical protein [Chitinophagales bacterium]
MRLIEQYEIEIPEEKIVSYLLSSTHRIGNHKAEFFSKIGYSQTNWKEFNNAIIILVDNCDAQLQKQNHF